MLIKVTVSLLYLGTLVVLAVRARKRTHDIDDYYVGGRNVPTVLVVLSFYATFVSTNSFIGHSGKSYVYGVSWLLVGLVLVLLAALSWLVVAPRFRRTAGKFGLKAKKTRALLLALLFPVLRSDNTVTS